MQKKSRKYFVLISLFALTRCIFSPTCDDIIKKLSDWECVLQEEKSMNTDSLATSYIVAPTGKVEDPTSARIVDVMSKNNPEFKSHQKNKAEFVKDFKEKDLLFLPEDVKETSVFHFEIMPMYEYLEAKKFLKQFIDLKFMDDGAWTEESRQRGWEAVRQIAKIIRSVLQTGYGFEKLSYFSIVFIPNSPKLLLTNFYFISKLGTKIAKDQILFRHDLEYFQQQGEHEVSEADTIHMFGFLIHRLFSNGNSMFPNIGHFKSGDFAIDAGVEEGIAKLVHGCVIRDKTKRFKLDDIDAIIDKEIKNPQPKYLKKRLNQSVLHEYQENGYQPEFTPATNAKANATSSSAGVQDNLFNVFGVMMKGTTLAGIIVVVALALIAIFILVVVYCIRKEAGLGSQRENATADRKNELIDDKNQTQIKIAD